MSVTKYANLTLISFSNLSDLHMKIFNEKNRQTLNAITEDVLYIPVISSRSTTAMALMFLNTLLDVSYKSITSEYSEDILLLKPINCSQNHSDQNLYFPGQLLKSSTYYY